ncbi:MAG TPA: hypothetical protein VGN10_06010 [Pyrinomonadaceae bacterium]|jgi:hypothetical protein
MNAEPVSDALLRQFLLGQVDDQERQRLESMFVTGALSRERVMAAEQHLMDDFLDDSLTPKDKERFLAQYGETPAEQRKLRIAQSIHDWAATEATAVAATAGSRWSSLFGRIRLKPIFAVPVAAVVLIAIVVAVITLRSRWEQQNIHLAMQQELERLNSPSMLREPSAGSVTLTPGTVRSAEAENEVTPPANAEFVELRLLWTQKERFPSYQATIRRFEEEESFTIPNLQLDSGNVIRLRLPPRLLTRGLYQIEVSGVDANGTTGPTEEYKFVARD